MVKAFIGVGIKMDTMWGKIRKWGSYYSNSALWISKRMHFNDEMEIRHR